MVLQSDGAVQQRAAGEQERKSDRRRERETVQAVEQRIKRTARTARTARTTVGAKKRCQPTTFELGQLDKPAAARLNRFATTFFGTGDVLRAVMQLESAEHEHPVLASSPSSAVVSCVCVCRE